MGQKVHPVGIRLGITKKHASVWYAESSNYADYLLNDHAVREFVYKEVKNAMISQIEIQRLAKVAIVSLHTPRPGILIGKKGEGIENLKKKISQIMNMEITLNVVEIKKPELDAFLVAKNIAQQLEKRVQFRRAMKRAIQSTMKSGALGIKVKVSGRLAGAEIARSEAYHEGRVPLHTFRADIDYSTAEAATSYGIIGVKVWIFKGEIFETKKVEEVQELEDNTDTPSQEVAS